MLSFWDPLIETAEWSGCDLSFTAITDAGIIRYLVGERWLLHAAQRTSTEALSLNLPALREPLIRLASGTQKDDILMLE